MNRMLAILLASFVLAVALVLVSSSRGNMISSSAPCWACGSSGHFERLEHVRKKYACPSCEHKGENPRIAVAAKAETRYGGFIAPILPVRCLNLCPGSLPITARN